jgi:hypothetical protein
MSETERGQWKLVFNKAGAGAITMWNRRPISLTQGDIRDFVIRGMGWKYGSDLNVTCTLAHVNDKGKLKACLSFSDAALAAITTEGQEKGADVGDLIVARFKDGLRSYGVRDWNDSCKVQAKPIQAM